jgi:hypothetical protein
VELRTLDTSASRSAWLCRLLVRPSRPAWWAELQHLALSQVQPQAHQALSRVRSRSLPERLRL